jgi:hypothetical protein
MRLFHSGSAMCSLHTYIGVEICPTYSPIIAAPNRAALICMSDIEAFLCKVD